MESLDGFGKVHVQARFSLVSPLGLARSSVVVRARIDGGIKEAAAVLAAVGLTISDAFRLMMERIAAGKALPFEPLVPNADTVEAIEAARRGELATVGLSGSLLAGLLVIHRGMAEAPRCCQRFGCDGGGRDARSTWPSTDT